MGLQEQPGLHLFRRPSQRTERDRQEHGMVSGRARLRVSQECWCGSVAHAGRRASEERKEDSGNGGAVTALSLRPDSTRSIQLLAARRVMNATATFRR